MKGSAGCLPAKVDCCYGAIPCLDNTRHGVIPSGVPWSTPWSRCIPVAGGIKRWLRSSTDAFAGTGASKRPLCQNRLIAITVLQVPRERCWGAGAGAEGLTGGPGEPTSPACGCAWLPIPPCVKLC